MRKDCASYVAEESGGGLMNLALAGFSLFAAGAIALATATGGVVVGAIVCMAWGVLFFVIEVVGSR